MWIDNLPTHLQNITSRNASQLCQDIERWLRSKLAKGQNYWFQLSLDPNDPDTKVKFDQELAIIYPVQGYTGNERTKQLYRRAEAYWELNDFLLTMLCTLYWHIPDRADAVLRHASKQLDDPLAVAKAWWEIKELDGRQRNTNITFKFQELQKAMKYTGDYPGYIPAVVTILQDLEAMHALPQPMVLHFNQVVSALINIPKHFKQKAISDYIASVRRFRSEEWLCKEFTIEDFETLHEDMMAYMNCFDVPIVDNSTTEKRRRNHKRIFMADDSGPRSKKEGPCTICQKKEDIPERIARSHHSDDHDEEKISKRYRRVVSDKKGRFHHNKKPSARRNRSENPSTNGNTAVQHFSKYSQAKVKQIRKAALAKGRREGIRCAAYKVVDNRAKKDKKSTRCDADEIFSIFSDQVIAGNKSDVKRVLGNL